MPGAATKTIRRVRETDLNSSTVTVAHQTSQAFPVGIHEFIRRSVECFLVVLRTKVVGRIFENGLGRSFGIDIHSADRTKRMFGSRDAGGGVKPGLTPDSSSLAPDIPGHRRYFCATSRP